MSLELCFLAGPDLLLLPNYPPVFPPGNGQHNPQISTLFLDPET
jgi:hypothetical protein